MRKKLRIIITLILAISIVFIFLTFNKKKNINKIYPPVVHLECKNDKTTTVGSGIVYNEKNNKYYIVTSYHIIKGYANVFVYDERLNKEKAIIINYDDKNDIAILAVNKSLDVKKATFDTSGKILESDEVYILTSFIGKDKSYIVKDAIISKLKEKINLNNQNLETLKLSYDIENGDSGSPVINKKGKVIGMIFLKDKDTLNYGYALPINHILNVVKKLEKGNNSLNLGALMTNSSNKKLLEEYKIKDISNKGVVILSLKKNYPLYNSGLEKGDIIVSLNNSVINNVDDLKNTLKEIEINQEVKISYYRNYELIHKTIKLDK